MPLRNPAPARPGPADLVLAGGRVHPDIRPADPWQSLAIADGRIAYRGPEEGLAPWIGPRTRRIDLHGRTVLPGFVDAHLHPLLGGVGLLECNLSGLSTLSEYQRAVRAYADAHPEAPFIRGGGWIPGAFPRETPTRDMLEAIVPGRPVLLKAMDGHSLWANGAALRIAGIQAGTPQPPGGRIVLDPATGEPTGWLQEWSAMALLESHFPSATHHQRRLGARAFLEKAARAGITAVSDAMLTETDYRVYADLERSGELTVRVTGLALRRPEDGESGRQEILSLLQTPRTDRLQVRAVKLFLDGVLEARTAWLREPYADMPDHRGTLIWPEEDFRREVLWWDAHGIPVHVHAIGDAAVALAVDAFAEAANLNGRRDLRHQIAHLDMIQPPEIARMKAYGIHAVVQPAWCYMDHAFFDTTLPFLGRERASRLYPFRSLRKAGVPMAFSSDWPFGGDTAAFAPLEGIQVAATRLGLDPDFSTVYGPDECLPLPDLLDAYTRQGAFAQFRENDYGALRPGMRADLLVLGDSLSERLPDEIHSARVALTLMNGRPVFEDPVALAP